MAKHVDLHPTVPRLVMVPLAVISLLAGFSLAAPGALIGIFANAIFLVMDVGLFPQVSTGDRDADEWSLGMAILARGSYIVGLVLNVFALFWSAN
jgi:hypothetical protein